MRSQRPLVNSRMGRSNKPLEQRMRLVRFDLEVRMKLAGDKRRMLRQFDDLHQLAVGREAAECKIRLLKFFPISIVELVTVPMTFVDDKGAIKPRGFCADD